MPRKKKGTVLAVDLGTETTLLAHMDKDGHVEVVPDPDGLLCTPTAVAFESGDAQSPLFGRSAKSYRKMHPEHVCVIAKRARGRQDAAGIVDKVGKSWSTEELEALFLDWRLRHAETFLGAKVGGVLATVPAAFNDGQRRATQTIVENAGYASVGIVNEPTAALLGYAREQEGVFAIADIGGGTFDVTILRVEAGSVFTTLATAGQDDLGGREYTLRLVEHCVEHAGKNGRSLDPASDLRDLVGLEIACEEAKRELTAQKSAFISFRAKDQLLDIEVSRVKFDELTADINDRIAGCFRDAMEHAQLQPADLSGVVFAGGASRVPGTRGAIEDLVGADKVLRDIDPDTAVVTGACQAIGVKLQERQLAGDAQLVQNVSHYLLKGQAAIHDVTGQDLGVAALKHSEGEPVLAVIVERGTPLPATGRKLFGLTNGGADQVQATVSVLEGHGNAPASDCHALAEFPLANLPAGPTDERVEIGFEVNTDGLVSVHAVDTHSGVEIREQVLASEGFKASAA